MNPNDRKVELALSAAERLARLRADPDFPAAYARGKADAIEAFNVLLAAKAEGVAVARRDITAIEYQRAGVPVPQGPDPSERIALDQQHHAMLADPEFAQKLQRGDPDAVRMMREHNLALAAHLGVDPAAAVGTPAPQVTELPGGGVQVGGGVG
jgi:hypothetical protein